MDAAIKRILGLDRTLEERVKILEFEALLFIVLLVLLAVVVYNNDVIIAKTIIEYHPLPVEIEAGNLSGLYYTTRVLR